MLEVILMITKLMSPRSPVKIDEKLVPVFKIGEKSSSKNDKVPSTRVFWPLRCDSPIRFQSFGM